MRALAHALAGAALVIASTPSAFAGFDFDEIEAIDRADAADLLGAANRAARREDFSRARDLIEQARNKAYAPQAVGAAEGVLRDAKAAYDDRKRREEEERLARLEAERRAAEQAARDASGDMGGALRCGYVSKNHGLWRYCSTGDCGGLSGDYGLYRLCSADDPGGLSGNYTVYSYLTTGSTSGFTDYRTNSAAAQAGGSFADRKRFIIYYLNGYTYR